MLAGGRVTQYYRLRQQAIYFSQFETTTNRILRLTPMGTIC